MWRHEWTAQALLRLGNGLPGQQLQAASRGQCLHAVRKLTRQPFEGFPAGDKVLEVLNLPGSDEPEPAGPFGVRAVGHFQEQLDLLDPELSLIQMFGEGASELFASRN